MSNSYFQFREFRIEQEHCAMKVSTDACIQGAWAPIAHNITSVLDIGTGTGLLSLMLAQRNANIHIDAIELDGQAAAQAQENINASPWADRVHLTQGDVRTYKPTQLYDMIICNPPFFQKSLLGDDAARNAARHTLSLSYDDLLRLCIRLLQPQGYAAVMLPAAESLHWEALVRQAGWYIINKLLIVPKEGALHNRVVSLCAKQPAAIQEEIVVIRAADGSYTPAFTDLLRPYYLQL